MNDKEKIEYLMSIYGLTPSQFADRTGIQRASVSHILSNRNKPSLEILLKVYNAFPGISLNWLILGEGDAPVLNNDAVAENDKVYSGANEAAVSVAPATLFPVFMEENTVSEPSPTVEKVASVALVDSIPVNDAVSAKQVVAVDGETSAQPSAPSVQAEEAAAVASLALSRDTAKNIKEIKIFYDNGTYETFLPEKC